MESRCIFASQTHQDDQEPKKYVLDFIFPLDCTLCCGLSFPSIYGFLDRSSFGYNICKSTRPHLILQIFYCITAF
jgi:hypothetical protein